MLLNNHLFKRTVLFILIIIFLLNPSIVFANSVSNCEDNIANCLETDQNTDQLNVPENEQTESTTGSLILGILKTGFALLLILALIYIMIKLLGKKNLSLKQTKVLENLGGISLGQNKSLQMVRVGNKILLIGVGENIELLYEITDEAIIETLLHNEDSIDEDNHFLASILSKLGRDNNKHETNFKGLFASELNKLKKQRNKVITRHKEKEDQHE